MKLYRCDGCGETREGEPPHRLQVIGGYNVRADRTEYETCSPACYLAAIHMFAEGVAKKNGLAAVDSGPIASVSLVPLDRDVVEAWISEASPAEVEEIRIACSRRADGPTPGDPRLVVLVREAVRLLGHVAAIPTGPVDSARCILAEALTLYGSTPEPPR